MTFVNLWLNTEAIAPFTVDFGAVSVIREHVPDAGHNREGSWEQPFDGARIRAIGCRDEANGLVPPAVFGTPDGSLCCRSERLKLSPAIFGRAEEAVGLDQPGRVVGLAEREQRLAQLLDGLEGSHPEQVLLQRADEPLGAAIAFRGADEGRRAVDAEEGQFLLEMV